jgi:hypothetical protein
MTKICPQEDQWMSILEPIPPLKLMSINHIYQGNMWKQQGGNR